jgi:Family of unknown function (DUF6338)
MPTTLTGLVLFVVLLLPGFAYLVGKERYGTERVASPFRETVAVVAASVTSELIVLVLFAIVRSLWPGRTPDVWSLIRYPGLYLRGGVGFPGHYREVAGWGVGMLVVAVAFAYLATVPTVRQRVQRLPFVGEYPHDSTVSAWWVLFEKWGVGDSADRELILRGPIRYRPPGDEKTHEYPAGAVCISARRIVAVFVNYADVPSTSSSSEEGGPVGAASTVVGHS